MQPLPDLPFDASMTRLAPEVFGIALRGKLSRCEPRLPVQEAELV